MCCYLVRLGGLGHKASSVVVHQEPARRGALLGLHSQRQGDRTPLRTRQGQQRLTVLQREGDRDSQRITIKARKILFSLQLLQMLICPFVQTESCKAIPSVRISCVVFSLLLTVLPAPPQTHHPHSHSLTLAGNSREAFACVLHIRQQLFD